MTSAVLKPGANNSIKTSSSFIRLTSYNVCYTKLLRTVDSRDFAITPASADASFRRYFRATFGTPPPRAAGRRTLIVMDAPPAKEDSVPFVHVARLLREAGVHAPEVLAADLERGFLLLTDLGDRTYLSALDADSAAPLRNNFV